MAATVVLIVSLAAISVALCSVIGRLVSMGEPTDDERRLNRSVLEGASHGGCTETEGDGDMENPKGEEQA